MPEPISTSGPRNARIMIVGEAPGADEVREGIPFVGYTGKLLDQLLHASGIDPASCFKTNLCRYRPPGNELRAFFDNKGIPNSRVIEGLQALQSDIQSIKPNVILALGNYPLRFLTGRGNWKPTTGFTGISDHRGYIHDGRAVGAGFKVLPTFHPAATSRDYSLKHLIQHDLGRLVSEQQFPEIRYPRRAIIVDPADRAAWTAWLIGPAGRDSPRFAFSDEDQNSPRHTVQSDSFLTADIEYIGARLLCLGVTRHPDVAIVLPTPNAHAVDHVRGILLSGVPLCLQNAMFDCSILEWHYDIPCLKYLLHDTFIAMHAAYTEFPRDLGFIATLQTEWWRRPPWWEGINGDYWKGVKAGTREVSECFTYNGGDVCVTHEAMRSLLSDELQNSHISDTYRHEMNLVSPLWRIGRKGVQINTVALATLSSTLETEAHTLSAGVAFLNGGKAVNVKAPQQVAAFIYETMGLPKGEKTTPSSRFPTGQWKMDDTTLATISLKAKNDRQRTAIRLIRDARERLDLISKFCEIELDDDSRMRCHYDPAKTLTGRLASRNFYPTGRGANLQNIPKDPRVRAVFVPDPGYVFCYADLKSAESYVVAHITGDPEMLRLHSAEYMSGELDGHKYVASFLLDKPIERITKDERYLGKRCRHAGNYGLGWFKLMQLINADAQKTGVSIDAARAKSLVAKYRQLHPFLANWWAAILAELWETHTLYTHHGRPRVFYGRPNEILPEAIAYDPQGTVAQTLNMGLMRIDASYSLQLDPESTLWQKQWDRTYDLDRYWKLHEASIDVNRLGLQMLLQVHDAIGFQVPEANAGEVIPLVRDLMAIPVQIKRRGVDPYLITIPVDIQVGYNWGESDEDPKHPGFTKEGKPAVNPNGLKVWNG